MYIARIEGVFDEYFFDKFIWDEPSDVRKYLNELRNDYMFYCHFDERKEMYGANELEKFYQLRFKYKKKWNNDRENKVD